MYKFRKELRLVREIKELEDKHKGKEWGTYSYHGGFSLGYKKGMLEGIVHEMSDEKYEEFTKLEKELLLKLEETK